jgi:hypothetical protein
LKPKIPIWVNSGGSRNGRCWCILWPFGIFVTIWYILWPFGKFSGHLVIFMVIWYVLPRFGMFYQEQSGNPALLGAFSRDWR